MGGLHRPFMPRKPLDALQGPDAGEQLPGRTCSSRRLPCGERGVWGGAPGFDCERSPLQDIAVPEYQNIKSGDHTHPETSITEVGKRASAMRSALSEGKDPLEEKRTTEIKPSIPTFREAATALHESLRPGWKNQKHGQQWGFVSFRVESRPGDPNALAESYGSPTPNPAPEGGEVLSAGRARGLAAKSRNQPQAHERVSVSAPLKGSLRRAAPLTGPSTHSFRSRLRP